MNEFVAELKELIDKYREHPGVTDEDIIIALADMIEDMDDDDD